MIKKFELFVDNNVTKINMDTKLRMCKSLGFNVSGGQVLKHKFGTGWQMVCHIDKLELYIKIAYEKGEITDEDIEKFKMEEETNKYNL